MEEIFSILRIGDLYTPRVAFGKNPAFDPNVYNWYFLKTHEINSGIAVTVGDTPEFFYHKHDAIAVCGLFKKQTREEIIISE